MTVYYQDAAGTVAGTTIDATTSATGGTAFTTVTNDVGGTSSYIATNPSLGFRAIRVNGNASNRYIRHNWQLETGVRNFNFQFDIAPDGFPTGTPSILGVLRNTANGASLFSVRYNLDGTISLLNSSQGAGGSATGVVWTSTYVIPVNGTYTRVAGAVTNPSGGTTGTVELRITEKHNPSNVLDTASLTGQGWGSSDFAFFYFGKYNAAGQLPEYNLGNLRVETNVSTLPSPFVIRPAFTASPLLDFDPALALEATNAYMTAIPDSVANKNFLQVESNNGPLVKTGIASRKAAQFNNSYMRALSTGLATQTAVSVVAIMRLDAVASTIRSGIMGAAVPTTGNDYDTTGGWAINNPSGATTETTFQSLGISGSAATAGSMTGFTKPLNEWVMVHVKFSSDGTAPVLRINGVNVTHSATGRSASALLLANLTLGARQYGASFTDRGRFSLQRLLVYSGRTTTAQDTAINSWAADQYGITSASNTAPTANAGPDQTVVVNTVVTLNGSASTDADGTIASYIWTQISGASVTLSGSGATRTFNSGATAGTRVFGLVVTDNSGASSTQDTVTIVTSVLPGLTWNVLRNGSWVPAVLNKILGMVTDWASGALPSGYTARPSWTTASCYEPRNLSPRTNPGRTIELPNLPAAGGDIRPAWIAYWGDQVGGAGTWQVGDRVTIPANGYTSSGELVIPPETNYTVDLVTGSAGLNAGTQITFTSATSMGIRTVDSANIRIFGASSTAPLLLRSQGVAGRTGQDLGGHSLLCASGSSGLMFQDIISEGAKSAGVFFYRCTDYDLNRIGSRYSRADAFHNAGGCSYGRYTDCWADNPGDDCWAAVHYDRRNPATDVSHHIEVYRFKGTRNGHGRGFAIIACNNIYADQIKMEGTAGAGLIIDREATSTVQSPDYPQQSISEVLVQRIDLKGCNTTPKIDHGSVFIGNGNTGGTVTARIEGLTVTDNRLDQTAIRGVGSGTQTITVRNFLQKGGLTGSANNNRIKVGGNWTTPSTYDVDAFALDTNGPADSTAPSIMFLTPGHRATVSGTLTGSTTDTGAMSNVQAVQGYAGDTPSGLTDVKLYVDNDTTPIGTVAGSTFTSANDHFWAIPWNTTTVSNGIHVLKAVATDTAGFTTERLLTVTVAN